MGTLAKFKKKGWEELIGKNPELSSLTTIKAQGIKAQGTCPKIPRGFPKNLWAFIEKINEEGGVSNEAIQPTTPPGVSACSM